jgi:hypothetical protein
VAPASRPAQPTPCADFRDAGAMKAVAAGLLFLIILSLAAGLWFLVRDRGTSDRLAMALTLRAVLSFLLLLLVALAIRPG